MVICNECHAEVKETAKFCTNCGTQMDPAAVEKVEPQTSGQVNTAKDFNTKSETTNNQPSAMETYLFDYWDFLKESLITPSAVFTSENVTWINGLISLVLFSFAGTLSIYTDSLAQSESFFLMFFIFGIAQALYTGTLFVINKFLLGGSDDYLDTLGKYGGLINAQTILYLLISLFGIDSSLSGFLVLVLSINTMNIFNMYVLKSQTANKGKLDKYYQFIVSYIALGIMTFLIISIFANTIG